ncbi:hypothetical protein BH11PLA2_BH11PLA2_34270 [soil metagenome]
MSRSTQVIAEDFNALTVADFDYTNPNARGLERLNVLCDEISAINDVSASVPLLLSTIERLEYADLGTPGALVHTLEQWPGFYENALAESLNRKPTPLTVWMVNRILNVEPPDKEMWLSLLQALVNNPATSEEARIATEFFLKHQSGD